MLYSAWVRLMIDYVASAIEKRLPLGAETAGRS